MKENEYAQAKERVETLKGFYANLISYVAINLVLIVINLAVSPNTLWFYWVTIFWGVGLIFHAVDVFALRGRLLSQEWEERKIREVMNKEHRRKAG